VIFQDQELSPAQLTHKIRLVMKININIPKERSTRCLLMWSIDQEIPWCFFDIVFLGTTCICGVGTTLFPDSSHFLLLKYVTREGTNNVAELFSLWLLLKTTEGRGINHIHVFGDSNLFVYWADQHFSIENLGLLPIIIQV